MRDWPGLLTALRSDSLLARQLRQQFDAESLWLLHASGATPAAYERGALVRAFNGGVRRCTPTTLKAETPMERARESSEAISPPR